jgi:uncharacterized repeat protein (TIGR01451 family)
VLDISAVVSRDPIGAGQLLTYTFLFTNAGGHAAVITITADTPPGTTFEEASSDPDYRARVGGTGTVTWTFDELPMSGGGMVTMTVRRRQSAERHGDRAQRLSGRVHGPADDSAGVGPDVTTTVQTDLSLEIEKVDDPDGVHPAIRSHTSDRRQPRRTLR